MRKLNKRIMAGVLAGYGALSPVLVGAQTDPDVAALRQQLAARGPDAAAPLVGLDANAPKPPVDADVATTAIESTLVSKGLVLLPAGGVRITPSATWTHSGSGSDRAESTSAALSLEAGLPWGLATTLRVPYIQRDDPLGNNAGLGDLSFSLGKTLTQETATRPSLVLRLGYQHDNGADAFAAVPIGAGFRTLTATLSAVKRVEPLALYGHLSYSHGWPTTTEIWDDAAARAVTITPADLYGVGLGVSLAVTPEISLDSGLSFEFLGGDRFAMANGDTLRGTPSTAGYLDLGADVVLRKNLFLRLSAAAGITEDAEDVLFSLALPYRF